MSPLRLQSAGQENRSLEARLQRDSRNRIAPTEAESIERKLVFVEIVTAVQIINRPTEVLRPLNPHVAILVRPEPRHMAFVRAFVDGVHEGATAPRQEIEVIGER